MELITNHLDKIEDLILRLEDLMEASRPVAFSSKVSVDKNKVYDLLDEFRPCLDDIRHFLPDEIVKARRVVAESDKILEDARSKANLVLRSAEADVEKRVSEHEISRKADSKANEMVEDARKFAKELRGNALEYADEMLQKVEDTMKDAVANFSKSVRAAEMSFNETVDLIYENRQELRGGVSRG